MFSWGYKIGTLVENGLILEVKLRDDPLEK